MDLKTAETRFVTRTTLERRILSIVNSELGRYSPLNGLTDPAVSSWTRSMAVEIRGADLSQVLGVLEEFATRAELKADESRDTFEVALTLSKPVVGQLLQRLGAAARALRETVELGRPR